MVTHNFEGSEGKNKMVEYLFDRMNENLNKSKMIKIAKSLAAVTHTHTHIVF